MWSQRKLNTLTLLYCKDELKEIADEDKESVTTQLRLKTAVTTDTDMRITNKQGEFR